MARKRKKQGAGKKQTKARALNLAEHLDKYAERRGRKVTSVDSEGWTIHKVEPLPKPLAAAEIKKVYLRFWKRVADYANGTLDDLKDRTNIIEILNDFGWSIATATGQNGGDAEAFVRSAWASVGLMPRVIEDARHCREQARDILSWLAAPGKDASHDQTVVGLINQHCACVRHKLKLTGRFLLSGSFESSHFIDLIATLARDSIIMAGNIVQLPYPPPVRLCDERGCSKFFAQDGKNLSCEEHRGKKTRGPLENKVYQFMSRNLKLSMEKLQGQIKRYYNTAGWKLAGLVAIKNDRSKHHNRTPTDYVRQFRDLWEKDPSGVRAVSIAQRTS